MWKWILGAVGALVLAAVGLAIYLSDKIYLRFPHATVTEADFARRYQPEQLRADFLALTATAERIHPDIGAVTDAKAYATQKARTLAALDHPMTRIEFYRSIAPAVGQFYQDGHTELLPPQEEWDAYQARGGAAPPFMIRIDGQHVLVDRSLGDPLLRPGMELLSLNDVSEAQLRTWLMDTQSMESDAGRAAYAARRWSMLVWALGLSAPYHIVARAPGAKAAITEESSGLSAREWKRRFTLGMDQPVFISIDHGVAYLALKDFDQPWGPYRRELQAAFQKIRDAKVRAVVLDLRQNNGGDTRQSDALQTYLSDRRLPAVRSVEVKTTPEVKAAYRTLLPEGFRWIPINRLVPMLAGIQDAPDNGTYVFHPDGTEPTKRLFLQRLSFKGPLYVLIGPATYSTAVIAAAPYKYWRRAEIIGVATGEPLTFFGDNYAFDLPNTKLVMHVSHKRFVLFGSKGPRAGLEPDVVVAPGEDAYQVALGETARRQGAVR